jgi:hypothetical protein
LVKKYAKYESNMSKDIENIWGGTQIIDQSKYKRGNNSVKMLDTVVCSCL